MITKTVIMNSNRMKVTYKEGKKKWYGEYTRKDHYKGYGWNQWGADTITLSSTVDDIRQLVLQWIEEYL